MDIYSSYEHAVNAAPSVVVVGNFDGLHRGHMALIEAAAKIAKRDDLRLSILTFSPHPIRVLAPHRAPDLLMTDGEKASAFAALGVDAVWFQEFSSLFAQLTPDAFSQKVLCDGLNATQVVVGYDFRFGKGRSGDAAELRRLLAQNDVNLTIIEPVQEDANKVSSSAIRAALIDSDMDRVNDLLGWSYGITGAVLHGEAKGRTIGFPTLNIDLGRRCLPKPGVYAGWLKWEDDFLPAVANLGPRPTVNDFDTVSLEVHVPNHELPDLYGVEVEFVFGPFIREIRHFKDLEDLQRRLTHDVAEALLLVGQKQPKILSCLF